MDPFELEPVVPGIVPTTPAGLGFTPATRVAWRGADHLQLELGRRALVVEGIDAATASALAHRRARLHHDDGGVLSVLRQAGFLTRLNSGEADSADMSTALLAPELGSLAARFGEQAAEVLTARARRRVSLHGGGRLPSLIGSLLAAAGVGHVHVADTGDVHLRDAIPGGFSANDEGTRIATAAAAAIHRAAPSADTSTASTQPADLVVLTTGAPVPRALAAGFAFAGQPHLVTGVWGASAVIGPLVLPGRSSCLQCADLQRRDRDPAWPALAAQLASTRRDREPTDVCVSALAAAATALQCLQYLDGEEPASVDGTLELALPDWRLRRRSWSIHPDCRCAFARAS